MTYRLFELIALNYSFHLETYILNNNNTNVLNHKRNFGLIHDLTWIKESRTALEEVIRKGGVQRNGTIITWSYMLLNFADDINIIEINH